MRRGMYYETPQFCPKMQLNCSTEKTLPCWLIQMGFVFHNSGGYLTLSIGNGHACTFSTGPGSLTHHPTSCRTNNHFDY